MGSVTFSDAYSVSTYGSTSQSIRVNYSESYDMATNKTTISITSIEIKSNKTVSGPVVGNVTINGAVVKSLTGGYTNTASPSAGSWSTITNSGGGSVAVTHNADGTGSMTVGLTGGHTNGGITAFGISWNGRVFGVRTADSASVSLTPHPRGSSISSCSSSVATQGVFSLSVSRNSPAFYHKATLSVGGTTMYTSGAFATSMTCTIPRSWFSSYPSVTSLTASVSVQTYTDSSCATAVGGAATQTFTVTADAGMKPSVASGWVSHAYYNTGTVASGIAGYVKGHSKATISFNSSKITMATGAAIASYSVTCQGTTVSASPYRTPTLSSTSVSVVCKVTDSRGRSASETLSISVMDYAPPKLSGISVFRCSANGTADENGTYYSVKATRSFSSLNGLNSCTLKAQLAASGGSYGTAYTLTSGTASKKSGLSADTSYTVKITATDSLNKSAVYYASIPTRKWAMKFRSNGNGVAFGKAAETDAAFEVSPDWAVKFGQPLPVTSGGTGAASESAALLKLGAFDLGNCTAIPQNSDLDAYTTAGTYRCGSNAAAATLVHCPTTSAFKLIVMKTISNSYLMQIIYNYKGLAEWKRWYSSEWSAWIRTSADLPLSVGNGGTGAASAAAARTNLGAIAMPTVVVDNTTTSAEISSKDYTVSGSGVVIAYIGMFSTDESDYGTFQAIISYDGTVIMGEGTRWGSDLNYKLGSSTSVPIAVANGKKINLWARNSKSGTKTVYRRLLCFGCTVS